MRVASVLKEGQLLESEPLLSTRSTLDLADDVILVGRAADGDARAFEVLLRRYGGLARGTAARILGSTDEMDDVVQDAFITAWQRLPTLENGAVFKSWFMRIVSHNAIDRIRARRDHSDVTEIEQPAPESQSPEAVAESHTREQALASALRRLPDQQRRCWVLKEVSEYSYDEIAGELDVPVSTVRGLLARARKTLVTELEEWR